MTARSRRRAIRPAAPASLTAARFPLLGSFFGGYLHEDFEETHGSPEAALEAFLADAQADDARAIGREWTRFAALIAGLPVAQVRTLLREAFGCRWHVRRVADLRALFARVAAADRI